jgi:hypothetical protein
LSTALRPCATAVLITVSATPKLCVHVKAQASPTSMNPSPSVSPPVCSSGAHLSSVTVAPAIGAFVELSFVSR